LAKSGHSDQFGDFLPQRSVQAREWPLSTQRGHSKPPAPAYSAHRATHIVERPIQCSKCWIKCLQR